MLILHLCLCLYGGLVALACVINFEFVFFQHRLVYCRHILEVEKETYCWIMLNVMGMRIYCKNVATEVLVCTTAHLRRLLVSSALLVMYTFVFYLRSHNRRDSFVLAYVHSVNDILVCLGGPSFQ